MKFKKKVVGFSLGTILAATSVSVVSCTPNYIPHSTKAVLVQEIQTEVCLLIVPVDLL